jgi:molybdopterin synthase catalytic subunit
MHIELKHAPFNPYCELQDYQNRQGNDAGCGATAIFVGSMRDFNEGDEVRGMFLEHYPGMTEKQLQSICAAAAEKWTLLDILVLHRVGEIAIGESIVLVSVWAAHRGDAFDACRTIMEELKHNAPFWKKETLAHAERWVAKNTTGYANPSVKRPE